MSWEAEIKEMAWRRERALEMGGADAVARQHRQEKLTARERIDRLLDPGSFREIGTFAGSARYREDATVEAVVPANTVIGKGRIDGRRVVVAADDFTIRGGSTEATNPEKWQYADRFALAKQVPMIRLVDSAGGSIRLLEQMQSTKIPGYPHWNYTEMMGVIPVVGAALGSIAGLGAVKVVASHFSVIVKGTSQVFAAGPPVVERGLGEKVTKEELGGSQVHARGSGVVDNEAQSEDDAFQQIRRFLSYLPANVYGVPPSVISDDDPSRRDEFLLSAIPRENRRPYDVRKILESVLDRGSLFEIGRHQGPSTVACLARLRGHSVGVLANDPLQRGGSLDAGAAEKITRFVDMCDTFHIPVVNFVDQPGVMVGTAAEARGTVRLAVRAIMAIRQSRTPFVSIIMRRVFGVAGGGHGPIHGLNERYAWPSGYWGSIPVEGGVEAAFSRDIEAAADPAARRAELETYYRRFASPFRTAERFGIPEIIDPRDTRPLLCEWVEEAYDVVATQLGPTYRTMRS
ncbi:MAG: propionyl-CoA carboxylase [Candidatus Rokubacteria bacterium]|nr:propionyl-CoA carboxylase [Candidatus Rokubacteria bacterium]